MLSPRGARGRNVIASYAVRAFNLYWLFVKRFRKLILLISIFTIIILHSFQLAPHPAAYQVKENISFFSQNVLQQVKNNAHRYLASSYPAPSSLQSINSTQVRNLLHTLGLQTPLAYKHLVESSSFESVFSKAGLSERCQTYFNSLAQLRPDWKVDAIKVSDLGYNRDYLYSRDFVELRVAQYKAQVFEAEKGTVLQAKDSKITNERALWKFKNSIKVPKEKLDEFEKEFEKSLEKNNAIEHTIIDGLTHLRVFGKCYLHNGFQGSVDIESRLFPWLTGKLPIFQRWDNEKIYTTDFPDIASIQRFESFSDFSQLTKFFSNKDDQFANFYVSNNQLGYLYNESEIRLPNKKQKEEHKKAKDEEEKIRSERTLQEEKESSLSSENHGLDNNFVSSFKYKLRGKGIVITASDTQVNDLLNLIKVLRALNNKLPIEIIHREDLSTSAREQIIAAGRERIEVPYSYHKVQNILSSEFSKQEIWFVDVSSSINPAYSGYFTKYANKLLATFFNSFEEMILMDIDVIPFVNPNTLFLSDHYVNSGTYFFKDREMHEKQKLGDNHFFRKLMPSKIDNLLFGIPEATAETLENRYLKYGYVHMMESGIVVLNKVQHLSGIATMMQLQLYEPIAVRVWGDKELFWLGLSISGDENYSFNRDSAYAVGEKSDEQLRFSRSTKFTEEVCSSHPGHVDEHGKLLWINSGFKNCKNLATYEEDSKSYKWRKIFQLGRTESEKLQKKLKYYYNLPTRINYGILPTVDVKKYRRSVQNGNVDERIALERTWCKREECLGYLWCGYVSKDEDEIAKDDTLPDEFHGKAVQFDDSTKLITEYLGDLWIANYVEGYKLPDEIEVDAPAEGTDDGGADNGNSNNSDDE